MNVGFADSFWKSLEKIRMHNTWWYKTYEVFRYKIPVFFKNLWFFRKQLWEFRPWDYSYNLQLFSKSIESTCNYLEFKGNEIEETKNKKVQKMKRLIKLFSNINSDSYIEMAEKELGEITNIDWEFEEIPDKPGFSRLVDNEPEEVKAHNSRVYNRADEIEAEEWKEIWRILEGQNMDDFKKIYDQLTDKEKFTHDHWARWFDGSGMKNWWD